MFDQNRAKKWLITYWKHLGFALYNVIQPYIYIYIYSSPKYMDETTVSYKLTNRVFQQKTKRDFLDSKCHEWGDVNNNQYIFCKINEW